MLNRDNPRSLAWIAQTLASRIVAVERHPPACATATGDDARAAASLAVAAKRCARCARSDNADLVAMLRAVVSDACAISTHALSQRYFSHAEGVAHAVGLDMRLSVTHETRYEYAGSVEQAHHIAHLRPLSLRPPAVAQPCAGDYTSAEVRTPESRQLWPGARLFLSLRSPTRN